MSSLVASPSELARDRSARLANPRRGHPKQIARLSRIFHHRDKRAATTYTHFPTMDGLVMAALGAEVVPMEFTLVYPALKDSRIDGEENPIMTIFTSHFEQVQKYVSLTGHFFGPIAFVANRDTFESLKPADQAAVMAAAKAGAELTWKMGADAEAKKLEQLRKGGMDVLETVDRQPFIDALKPLEPEFEKRFGKQVLAEIRATP